MSLELVIFDVDGLLLDTERIWQSVWRDTAKAFHLDDLADELFFQVLGRSGREVEQILIDCLQSRCDENEFLKVARRTGLKRLEQDLTIKPGGKELLDALSNWNIKTAVATSTDRSLTIQRLKQTGIYEQFSYICCGDEVSKRKPDPEIYLRVLTEMNVSPHQALILEDSYVGVEAADRAHIPCIMVPDLMMPTKREYQITKAIAKDLFEVKARLEVQ